MTTNEQPIPDTAAPKMWQMHTNFDYSQPGSAESGAFQQLRLNPMQFLMHSLNVNLANLKGEAPMPYALAASHVNELNCAIFTT